MWYGCVMQGRARGYLGLQQGPGEVLTAVLVDWGGRQLPLPLLTTTMQAAASLQQHIAMSLMDSTIKSFCRLQIITAILLFNQKYGCKSEADVKVSDIYNIQMASKVQIQTINLTHLDRS